MRVAHALGAQSPRMLQAQLSAQEYNNWQKYLSQGTSLERLIDRHFATLEAMFFNVHRGKNMARKTEHFLRLAQPAPPPFDGDAMAGKMLMITRLTGGKIIDGRKD